MQYITTYRRSIQTLGIPVKKMILFGSYAKGTAKPWSDVDVCVVSDQFGKDYHAELVSLLHLTSSIDAVIEPHPFHPKDLEDPLDPLAHEIRTTGKVV